MPNRFLCAALLLLLSAEGAFAAEYIKGGYCTEVTMGNSVEAEFICGVFGDRTRVTIPEIYKRGWKVAHAVAADKNSKGMILILEEQPQGKR